MKYARNIKHYLAALIGCFALITSAHAENQSVDERKAVAADARVKIDNLRGKVTIIGTDDDEVWVKGRLDEKATDFVFTVDGKRVTIVVKMPKQMNSSFWDNQAKETDLVINLPKTADVSFKGVSSDVVVSNIHNDTSIKTVSGSIDAKNLSKDIELESVSGNVDTNNLDGHIRLSTVSGDINDKNSKGILNYHAVSGDIDAQSVSSEVTASVVSGELDIELEQVKDANLSSVSGNVDAKVELSDNGLLRLSTVSGKVELAMQKGVNADITVNSNAGGRIINKVSDDEVDKAKYGPSSKLETRLGNGSALVKASTVSGNVVVAYQ
ncbi:hypothetical protein E2K93_05360 [Thalassotalea sp. HSM 43]|uniref:DUF4097 family beta strand repeat-containing protein n=1 Tax=Thalassotalea sp. HSM 43 TaxID=2552945 RepID=UPI001080A6AF|nr:DUF4097 family beta strand repeat-containing protein [Thalassotalea sp. HSM 43]QBY03843.1 hypothetical protein E2K93_05360 [Thalassotalea sp. HSM 43]